MARKRRLRGNPREVHARDADETFELHPGLGGPSVDEEALIDCMLARLRSLKGVGKGASGRRAVEILAGSIQRGQLDLPRLPSIAQDLMSLSPDSLLDYRQVAELITKDQDLVARILQVANSPVYTNVPVTSLEQAVAVLGLDVFCSVVVGVVATSAIYKVPGYEREVREERDHSMEVATISARLCRRFGRDEWHAMTFLGGLLHDAGRVLVLRNLSLLRRQHPDVIVGPYLRERLLEELHVPLGLYYGLHRGLAKEVRDVIVFHHQPLMAPIAVREPVMMVAIADALSESSLPAGSELIHRQVASSIGLEASDVASAHEMLKAGVEILRELRAPLAGGFVERERNGRGPGSRRDPSPRIA